MNCRTKGPARLPRPTLAAIFFAVFVVALGFGVILPILPPMVERLLVSPNLASLARHTALLTGAFTVAPLATALPWGRLSDRYGRRPILVLGLAGFALTLAASALARDLPFLYLARLLNGGFAAAVLPTALALVADTEVDEDRRAQTFGWVTIAFSLGLLAGPMLGGFASSWGATVSGGAVASYDEALPFLLVAGMAVVAATAVMGFVRGLPRRQGAGLKSLVPPARSGEVRLLALAAIAAAGLGAFEVGLTLRSRALAMTPATLGLMFAACMAVMLFVQGIAFSRLVKPATTRRLIAPSFAVLGLRLAFIPFAGGSYALSAATGMVAAASGFLTPVIAYWVSWVSGRGQGAELGLQTAAVSFGHTLGAAGAGLLFEFYDKLAKSRNGDVHMALESLAKALVIAVLVGGVALVLVRWLDTYRPAAGLSNSGTITEPLRLSASAAKGKILFEAKCASCHGERGAGTDQGPPFVHDIYNPGHHSDEAFFLAPRIGVRAHHWKFGDMPPVEEATDDELGAIVRYVRELQEANGVMFKPHVM